ncbi:hypothetical protein [Aeoliella sp.]|uniref:hypothetical protein n=1 Tax=Aeoliella sp. TaxID=2795800 RepID=UPI003CCB7B71
MRFVRATFARLRRLHPFTWCVVLLVSVAMVLIVVPGDLTAFEFGSGRNGAWELRAREIFQQTKADFGGEPTAKRQVTANVRLFEHGWPRPFLFRTIGSTWKWDVDGTMHRSRDNAPYWLKFDKHGNTLYPAPYHAIRWSSTDHWPLEADAWAIDVPHLLIDMAVAVLVIVAIGFVAERWIRWRGGLLRFRLLEMLAATTVCAMLLGWYTHHTRAHRLESEVLEQCDRLTEGNMWQRSEYVGPEWLRCLVGNDQLIPLLHHTTHFGFQGQGDWHNNTQVEQSLKHLERLPYLEYLEISQPVRPHLLPELQKLSGLKALEFPAAKWLLPDSPKEASFVAAAQRLNGPQFHRLEPLRLAEIRVYGPHLLVEDAEELAKLPGLHKLELVNPLITNDELDALQERHPAIVFRAEWRRDSPSPVRHQTVPTITRPTKIKNERDHRAQHAKLLATADAAE